MKYSPHSAAVALQKSEAEAFDAARYVRNKFDHQEQSKFFEEANQDSEFIKKFIVGVCFAKNWQEVWQQPCIGSISSAAKSLDYFSLIINRYSLKIERHIAIRNALHFHMLQGEWDIAQNIIADHQFEFGPTLWSLNWKMLLIEESQGIQYRVKYINSFENEEFSSTIRYFTNMFGFSSDQTLPEESYRKIVNNTISGTKNIKQFLEVLLLESCEHEIQIADLLGFFEYMPVIDRYETFTKFVAIALSAKHPESKRLLRTLKIIQTACNDETLKYIFEASNNETQISCVGETENLIKAWDAFMISDYETSFKIAAEIITKHPHALGAHELFVKSLIYLDKKDKLSGKTPASLISYNLCNVYLKNKNSDDSLNFLLRFGRRFRILALTHPLRALHAAHSSNFHDEKCLRQGSYAISMHGPRNFEYGHTEETNRQYLQRCRWAFPESISISYFAQLAEGLRGKDVLGCDPIPEIRKYFFEGIAAARLNDTVKCLAYLKHFLSLQKNNSSNPLSPFAIEEARRALIDVYRIKGDVIQMQHEVVKIYLDRPQSTRRLPIKRIFETCLENKATCCCHIEFPIIAHLACDDPHDVYLALNRFLKCNLVRKPTELLKKQCFSPKKLAILFIKVCTPEVIDSIDVLDSVARVEAERLTELRWVTKNVSDLSRLAETEILRLTQHAQLREALQKIEGARVVVNVAALRESENEKFCDAYLRFASQREMTETRTNEEVTGIINAISTLGNTPENAVLFIRPTNLRIQKETTLKAFGSAFCEIRDAFVYSPHFGIEACLSGRIRHGIVIQHLRKPFVEKKFAVLSDSSERSEIERYWQSRIPQISESQLEDIMLVLFQLTMEVNSVADKVKGIWLHSKTETKNPDGLFDFSFKTCDLEQILTTRMQDAKSLEIFLDRVFDVLLERTRLSLIRVKEMINMQLRESLRTAVDKAISSLPDSSAGTSFLALRNDLATCRQETERICDQMCAWFQESDATLMGDASMDLVARTAVGMIEQLNPEIRGKYEIQVDTNQRINGRHFTSLVHILFFMLENASRHTDIAKHLFRSNVLMTTDGSLLCMKVSSNMSNAESVMNCCNNLLGKVSQLSQVLDPETVIKEGGSGYAKIMAAIRYGFKQENPIVNAVSNGDNIISVSIKFGINGLCV